ncbi:hypothetical protein LOD99_2169 [Oopsacas minuta]|uniref:Clathrin/coatomer adaptor adaptin-like N-terminal domain-containing protein n=1 Tax=Oopsacas minuta TaxID=111878 RepID=A0AAV7K261_9METZ|nr:hypothetical protein LOD99_2169 [Oopsacas minuta]
MSTANSGYNASDVGISPDPKLSSVGFGPNFDNRRSSNYSLPGTDPTSFLSQNYRKFDELRRLLDNNKESLKLEAMRRIIEMVARGQNCSELFAAVVKNVVSKNTEIRKLVYVYLERYAEEQQDLSLLSVSTFQKALRVSSLLYYNTFFYLFMHTFMPAFARFIIMN